MGDLDEVVAEFLTESREALDRLEQDLVALEIRPHDQELLAGVFRCAHTIKGTSGFLGFGKLQSVTHAGESLLSLLRDGEIALSAEVTSALLAMVDAVRDMLAEVEVSGNDGETDHAVLVRRLTGLCAGGSEAPSLAPSMPPAPVVEAAPESALARAGETVRVDVEIIDRLIDLAGELVLTRNQFQQLQAPSEDGAFSAAAQRLNLITAEMQQGILRMRMMPIDNVLSKFPRQIRDLAQACGKEIRFEIENKRTELDKTLIEAIKDPLTHLLRNAVDHGIESPQERVRAGKPPEGVIRVRASHGGGQVQIDISDDGAGLPLDRIRSKALARGLATAEELEQMTTEVLTGLIFLPGFSTADQITNISGRGVGMDVVKTNIEQIGGTITIDTQRGVGTTFRIKIPLTLAIIPALILTVGRTRYAIPQVSVIELVSVDCDRHRRQIEHFHGVPVLRLRGKLLPLVFLGAQIGAADAATGAAGQPVHVVVLNIAECQYGLVVDRVLDQQEIVVKPLAHLAKNVSVFAGATILGDGRVALILDALGLAQRAGVLSETQAYTARVTDVAAPVRKRDLRPFLLLRSADDGRMVVPLDRVSRLETFAATLVERVGAQQVLRHGQDIMPLVALADILPERRARMRSDGAPAGPAPDLHVVVIGDPPTWLGLVVDDILDVVELPPRPERMGSRPGVLGCAVIQERVTEILDLDWVMARTLPADQPLSVAG